MLYNWSKGVWILRKRQRCF